MSKLKYNPKNKIKEVSNNSSGCTQSKDDILFEFSCITNNNSYSTKALKKDNKAIKEFIDLIETVSESTWVELQRRGKRRKGGFEAMYKGDFNYDVSKRLPIELSDDDKLHVFRFGSSDSYRMIGYKSRGCPRVIHVLAFDLDFSLYKHW